MASGESPLVTAVQQGTGEVMRDEQKDRFASSGSEMTQMNDTMSQMFVQLLAGKAIVTEARAAGAGSPVEKAGGVRKEGAVASGGLQRGEGGTRGRQQTETQQARRS